MVSTKVPGSMPKKLPARKTRAETPAAPIAMFTTVYGAIGTIRSAAATLAKRIAEEAGMSPDVLAGFLKADRK